MRKIKIFWNRYTMFRKVGIKKPLRAALDVNFFKTGSNIEW